MALCCPRRVSLRTCLIGLLLFSAFVISLGAAAPGGDEAPLDGQAHSTPADRKQVEGHFGRMTLFDQVLGYALGRFVNGFTAQQSRINFEQYLNPAEKELSVLLHALELFQQTVLPPVMEMANLPYEALKVARDEVDSLFVTLFGSEVLEGASGSVGLGSVDGSCDNSKTYSIRSAEDLQNHRADLECIFAGGEAPRRPPLGIVVGRVHEAGATDLFNLAMKIWWAGKLAFMTRCGTSRDVYMIQNLIHSTLDITAYAYVGKFTDPLGPGEHMDDKPSLIYDYTVDFGRMCPEVFSQGSQVHLGVINNEHMYRNVVDVLRKVGETEDGGHILLGKAMLRDPLNFPDNGDILAAFWSGVSYDHDAFNSSGGRFRLKPLDESFDYKHQSIVEVLRRFLPLIELLANPTGVGPSMYDSALRWKLGFQPLSPSQSSAAHNYRMGGQPLSSEFALGEYPSSGRPLPYLSGALPPRVELLDILRKFGRGSSEVSEASLKRETE